MKFKHPLFSDLDIERDDSEESDYVKAGWIKVKPTKPTKPADDVTEATSKAVDPKNDSPKTDEK